MAKLLKPNMSVGEAGDKFKTKTCSKPEAFLLPHQLCESSGSSRFSGGAVKTPVSKKKDKNIMLPHEYFGGSIRSRVAGEEILLPHQHCESSNASRISGGAIQRDIRSKKDRIIGRFPHEHIRSNWSGISGEDILLPHQQIGSRINGECRYSDNHEMDLKKKEKLILPHEVCGLESSDEKILLPHEVLGNKIDVSESVIKLKIGNKNDDDQKLRLPHERCQSGPCTLSLEIKMPREQYSQDIVLAMNLAGTAFEFSLRR